MWLWTSLKNRRWNDENSEISPSFFSKISGNWDFLLKLSQNDLPVSTSTWQTYSIIAQVFGNQRFYFYSTSRTQVRFCYYGSQKSWIFCDYFRKKSRGRWEFNIFSWKFHSNFLYIQGDHCAKHTPRTRPIGKYWFFFSDPHSRPWDFSKSASSGTFSEKNRTFSEKVGIIFWKFLHKFLTCLSVF